MAVIGTLSSRIGHPEADAQWLDADPYIPGVSNPDGTGINWWANQNVSSNPLCASAMLMCLPELLPFRSKLRHRYNSHPTDYTREGYSLASRAGDVADQHRLQAERSF
jgi:hypothetical protein